MTIAELTDITESRELDLRTEFRIPELNLERLTEKVAFLVKRAGKLGVPPPVLTIGSYEDVPVHKPDPFTGEYEVVGYERIYDVTLVGEAPKFAGWELAATLVPEEGGIIVRSVPGIDVPASYRTGDAYACDHCGQRRNRTETFVLRGEDGRWIQVGRDCIKDFLGHASPESLGRWLEQLHTLVLALDEDGEYGSRSHTPERWDVAYIVAIAAGAIKKFGWLGRGKAREIRDTEDRHVDATADRVSHYLNPLVQRAWREKPWDYTKEIFEPDSDFGDAALAHYREYFATREPNGEFEHNLKVIVLSETVKPKQLGFLAYLPAGYQRELDRRTEREAKKRAEASKVGNSVHLGAVGERLALGEVEVLFVRALDGDFPCYLHRLVDAEGNLIIWFGSRDLAVGEKVRIKATVKRHDVRDGVKQTVISRPTRDYTAEEKAEQKRLKKEMDKARDAMDEANAQAGALERAYWQAFDNYEKRSSEEGEASWKAVQAEAAALRTPAYDRLEAATRDWRLATEGL